MNRDSYDTAERQRYNHDYYEAHKRLKGRNNRAIAREMASMNDKVKHIYRKDEGEETSADGALHIGSRKRDPNDGGGSDFQTKDGTKYRYVGGRWVIDRKSLAKTHFKWAKDIIEKRRKEGYDD